jgi:lysophospholipase L1-like esterase
MLMRRNFILGTVAAVGGFEVAKAETWDEQWARRLREDWPGWRRYADNNATLIAAKQAIDVVLLGDSITEGWQATRPGFFSHRRICRGVSGETTPQMVLRMIPDVCDLKPAIVHILAGTNDIAGNTGKMTLKHSQDCYTAMYNIAHSHGIHVIFGSIPPADAFPWRPGLDTRTPIASLNRWLSGFAQKTGATFINYHSVLANGDRAMKAEMAEDGVHPTAKGYDAMATLLEPVLTKTLDKIRSSKGLKP